MQPDDTPPETLESGQRSNEFQTEQVLTIVGGHFVHDTYSAFFAPLMPLLQQKLGLSYGLLGSLAVFMQLPSLLNPLIGYLADRMSVRYFVIFAPALTATLMSLIGFMPNYASAALLLFAVGISMATFHAPAPAMIANIAGSRVGTAMGIFMAGGELGRTLGPIVIASAVAWFGLEGIWRLMFVGWIVSAVLYWRLHKVKASPRVNRGLPWAKVVRVFSVLAWLLLTRALIRGAVTTFLPTYMSDVVQANLWLAAAALSILEAAGVAGALFAGSVSDRYGRKRILFVFLTLSPLVLFAFLQFNATPFITIPLLLLLGLSTLATTPVFLAVVQDEFPNDRALANGILNALNFLVLGMGVVLIGVLADNLGLQRAFYISGFVAFLSIPSVFFLPGRDTQSA